MTALERRGEATTPPDRAGAFLARLLPVLRAGDAQGAAAAVGESDLPTREVLDLLLRARREVRRDRARKRAARDRAMDAALRALAEREDPTRPEDLERRRQIATLYRRLLALLTDGVLTIRPDGGLLHANSSSREALRLRLRELKDTPFPSLFANAKEGARVWRELQKTGYLRAYEVDLEVRGGRALPVRLAAARVEGSEPRYLVVFRDLTEIRHIRSRLLETEKLGAMAKIVGSVAHEIRNPLNAMFLNADLLEDELSESGKLSPSIEEILRVMREEIERLNEIIKNYLSLSKLGHASFETLDLNQVVQEFREEAEEAATRRGVSFEIRPSSHETLVRADRNMLRRVLVNLVQNALEATPEGGRIVIGARRLLHKAKLWVKDSGPGIPKEIEEQLFQPFFSTKERGTGLGLYLIREIVMVHEGQVALRSPRSGGTQATVLLPRLRDDQKETA